MKLIKNVLACGDFPKIENGMKVVLENKTLNSTHIIETKVEYECEVGFRYTKDNPTISCTFDGRLDGEPGLCVRGFIYWMFYYTNIYVNENSNKKGNKLLEKIFRSSVLLIKNGHS